VHSDVDFASLQLKVDSCTNTLQAATTANAKSPNTKRRLKSMAPRVIIQKSSPQLKHGAYSKRNILPGEKIADFEKLHQDVIGELQPDGPLEHDIVDTITGLLWRKQRLQTFDIARELTMRRDKIVNEELGRSGLDADRQCFRTEIYEEKTRISQRAKKQKRRGNRRLSESLENDTS
jgi:hypothetical protein